MTADGTDPGRTRRRIGWAIVGGVAAIIVASFAIDLEDDATGSRARGVAVTPVAAVAVERAPLTERGRYPGELTADAADVAAFYAGRLVAVNVRVGDTVAAGQVVAELDPVDAHEQISRAQAQAQAAAAEERRALVQLEAAETELTAATPLRDQVLSKLELDTIRARADTARAALATAGAREAEARAGVRLLQKRLVESKVRAPFAGRIAVRHVDPGAIVGAGDPLLRIVAIAPLRVRFEVPEHELAGLAVGTTLRVVTQAASAADAAAPATVTGVAGEIRRDRRVATLEALVEPAPAGWLPGMYAEAVVDRRTIADASVVPSAALLSRLQPDGTLATGVLVATSGVARWVPVAIAGRDGDRVAIQGAGEAIAPGAMVLVAGHVDLADGSKVQITGAGTPEPAR